MKEYSDNKLSLYKREGKNKAKIILNRVKNTVNRLKDEIEKDTLVTLNNFHLTTLALIIYSHFKNIELFDYLEQVLVIKREKNEEILTPARFGEDWDNYHEKAKEYSKSGLIKWVESDLYTNPKFNYTIEYWTKSYLDSYFIKYLSRYGLKQTKETKDAETYYRQLLGYRELPGKIYHGNSDWDEYLLNWDERLKEIFKNHLHQTHYINFQPIYDILLDDVLNQWSAAYRETLYQNVGYSTDYTKPFSEDVESADITKEFIMFLFKEFGIDIQKISSNKDMKERIKSIINEETIKEDDDVEGGGCIVPIIMLLSSIFTIIFLL